MDGILVVDKPAGFTSFDVVAKLRGICKTKKIGHGGTLDPMATGVLPVFIGKAAKAVDMQLCQDKTYEAEILFGIATDTGDVTGETLHSKQVEISAEQVQVMLPAFIGPQSQVPPMYSAIKVQGKPLYRYAREGKEVERKARNITIYEIVYLGQTGENRHRIKVHCSKGTYIRTLAEDIGAKLGTPATLAALRRTVAGVFHLEAAYTLEEIEVAKNEGCLGTLLQSVEVVFSALPVLVLEEKEHWRLCNGATVRRAVDAGRYRAYVGGMFAGIVMADDEGTLRAEKLFQACVAQ